VLRVQVPLLADLGARRDGDARLSARVSGSFCALVAGTVPEIEAPVL